MTKLRKLLAALPGAEVKGSKDISLSGMSNHSQAVAPGHLFVAKAGTHDHGSHYISQALRAGASAILTDLCDPSLKGVTQIIVRDVVEAEGRLAAAFYADPSLEMTVFGITGTNGKSTVATLIQQLWRAVKQQPCGLLGTIAYDLGRETIPASHTTPDAIAVQKLMREMRSQGCSAVSMEVSSHALDQQRCAWVDFDIGVFTNLTQDHLDYHGSMERYAAAKAQLFQQLRRGSNLRHAVAFGDDPWMSRVVGEEGLTLTTFGWSPSHTLSAQNIRLSAAGSSWTLVAPEGQWEVSTPLLGRHNILNVLAAVGAMRAHGCSLSSLIPKLSALKAPCGRLDPIANDAGLQILVDYAHTPDALEKVCATVKELTAGHLVVVFGAGGNRDRTKRPLMARAVAAYADLTIVTSDNPRYEDPEAICKDLVAGLEPDAKFEVIVDRAAAIRAAVKMLRPGDVLLIAGKGHESTQQIGNEVVPFCDHLVAKEASQSVSSAT
jgi:UDP-N-acetylmuramoyl-L-alanyl-D-glutamate--2,6-diaminopimelate ligase